MPDTTDQARGAASRLQDSRALTTAARVGFAMNGLLHVVIGVIALGVAFGGGGEADQGGALGQFASRPGGVFLLWLIVVGLWGLGLFQLLEAALVRGTDKDAWAERAKEGGKGVAYLAVGFTAFTFARGSSSDSSGQTQTLSARLLSAPGGVVLLVVVALAIVAIGAYFVVKGVKQKFREDLTLPGGAAGRGTVALGVTGYVAKGIALGVVGVLFAVAAVTSDPSEATGLDGALKALAALPFGVVVLTAVALGLMAYGAYCAVRARRARL
ncbi:MULTISPECIES: DUF1206 domain-containing protein [Frigoribacterium]|jgi:nitrogen fixation-related uncharacterized protein|uniref:DUF1206 domain-containing protein n=1 Tax=Frigoribacterium TaxID=96492 RepID=UPI001563CABF|nr:MULTISPECIES: DUF1206 domain-containing protein [Frigoribacterium]MBD8141526.1 DUF1206 domain-containing protein [Frigoribacterium sp. CFBP 13605]NQW86585.1 DUF1206 domain-containing protein [Frigoribacterium sp. VKM Ac-2860]NQX07916.1 DUF1206 domain-containing protein [Frigoribacterium sp. VKM Ac-2859]